MNFAELLRLARKVKAMRDTQKDYFAVRRKGLKARDILERCRVLESRVDICVEEILEEDRRGPRRASKGPLKGQRLLPGFGRKS